MPRRTPRFASFVRSAALVAIVSAPLPLLIASAPRSTPPSTTIDAQTPPPSAPPASRSAPQVDPPPSKREPAVRYGIPAPRAKRDGTLRLASYNLENLFDEVDDPALSGEVDDLAMKVPASRRAALGEAIRALNADVLCVQEVESLEALRWFRDQELSGMGYEHTAALDVGYPRGVEQGVLSRFPIVHAKVWPDADLTRTQASRTGEGWSSPREGSGVKYQRSPLFVQVRTPSGYVLDLFVMHHKAGGKEFAFQREAEALQTISFVKERLAEDPNANIAVLGDFNGSPSEKSVKVYLDPGHGGLHNAWEKRFDRNQPRDSYVTHASGRVIDYIFMSKGLEEDAVDRSFFVMATFDPGSGWNWKTDPPPERYASDHRPLAIDLVPDDPAGNHPDGGVTKLWGLKAPAAAANGAKGADGANGPESKPESPPAPSPKPGESPPAPTSSRP
ncbi:MAG: hypothetical protein FJ253_04965 [Phycisphaerae bacterium]|nr:hypothetical protein [Phycisphaerae bacterium]